MNEICKNAVLFLSIFLLICTKAYSSQQIEGYVPDDAKKRFGKGYIFDFDYSPDGTEFAVASSIGIWIYDAETREVVKLLSVKTDFLKTVKYSPDGKKLASGSYESTIKLWDVETGNEIHTLKGHDGFVHATTFSPDGKTLVSGSMDEFIIFWNLENLQPITTLPGHIGSVDSLTFSHNREILASSGRSDHRITLWNARTGDFIRFLSGHTEGIDSINFMSDGSTLVSGSYDGTIRFWNTETGKQLKSYSGMSAVISPEGNKVAAHLEDSLIQILNIYSGDILHTINTSYNTVEIIKFSPDGRILTSSDGKDIHFWNIETGLLIDTITGHTDDLYAIQFSHNGKTLVSLDGYIRIWDIAKSTLQKIPSIEGTVSSVALAPDAKTLACATNDNEILLLDMGTNKSKIILKGHENEINHLTFSPDGKILASASWDTIRLWDVITGDHITTITQDIDSRHKIRFTHNGDSLVFKDNESRVLFWNTETRKIDKEFELNRNSTNSIALSSNDKLLAIGFREDEIQIWDISTEKLLMTIQTSARTYDVAFSPDGKTIASCSEDIYLWDVETGKLFNTFTGHTDQVSILTFSPDGKTLASGGWDNTIILWDIQR
ncbi:hypothetical protein JT359_10700 [Candidatus Poribacteria bacterium]|nr:hypothetical protein [Candidatus Poribacteria bacterium]